MPVTRQKNKYILMVIDQFTKWLECYPIPNQTAETVATVLIDVLLQDFGVRWNYTQTRVEIWTENWFVRYANSSNTEDKNNSVSSSL